MKLIIEINVDSSDLEEMDAITFVKESKKANAVNVEVGRSVSERTPWICRTFSLSSEYFTVRVEDEKHAASKRKK